MLGLDMGVCKMNHKEIRNWYNKAFSGDNIPARPHESNLVYFDYMGINNGNGRGKKLLDIGCGAGRLLSEASHRGLDTYGTDLSDKAVELARINTPLSKISVGKSERLGYPDNVFDYVTCMGSLEHFIDMDKSVKEMIRVAKPEAKFCIMVPNIDFIYWKLGFQYGTKQQEIREQMQTLYEWKALFFNNGLRIVDVYPDLWHSKGKNIFLRLAWWLLPLRWTYCFIFILEKAVNNK